MKAIDNKQFSTWPGLAAASVQKHLPELCPATNTGHMKRQQKGLLSTTTIPDSKSHKTKAREALEKIETERNINPLQEVETQNQIFCYNRLMNRTDGTLYVHFTRKFPIRSMDGMVAICVVYDWTKKGIIATPVTKMKEEIIV